MNPNDPGESQDTASDRDTASTCSQPDSLFPLPHPPLNDEQQKKHDKVVNKLVKQQRKEEAQAVKATEKEKAKEDRQAEKEKVKEERQAEKEKAKEERKAEQETALAAKLEAEREKVGRPRHFIITPREHEPSRTRWEKVDVAGCPSEVDAHCGIFFREKNWDYDGFVERVGKWVQDLCEKKAKDALAY